MSASASAGDQRNLHAGPLAPGREATDAERALAVESDWVARHGVAPSLDHYRAIYEREGVEWPGDEVIRGRHFISDDGRISSPSGAGSRSIA